MIFKLFNPKNYILYFFIIFTLYGCGSSGSSGSSGGGGTSSKGALSFNYDGELTVSKGSLQQVLLLLNNSNNVTNQEVAILQSDPEVVRVSPSICSLSTQVPYCQVAVYGLKNGKVSLSAVSSGYETTSLPLSVGENIVYGSLAVESSLFLDISSLESGSPINIQFSTYSAVNNYYTINVTGGLQFSSGISGDNYALFNVTGNGPIVSNTISGSHGAQCAVSSQEPICTLTFYVPESMVSEPLSLTATIAGAVTAVHPYGTSQLIAVGNSNKYPGTIAIRTQSSASDANNPSVPINMSAPLFVNWNDVAIDGVVNVTLTSSNPSILSFYHYNPGNNESRQLSSTATCQLQFPPNTSYGLSCGLGLRGLQSGSATITAVANSNNGQQYNIESLNFMVVAQESTIRSITFTNNSTESIDVGITSGGANAYVSPNQPAVVPGAPGANIKPGGGSLCGPSNPLAACPIGASCVQGGSNPESSSIFFCFYDQSPPVCGSNCTNNYQLAPGGSTVFNISGSSGKYDPTGIIWSGNYFARTNCNPTTGICENASCNGVSGGLQCGPGTGGSPGVNTLAEVTFQRGKVDFYDVSIINGVNFATSFGPTVQQPLHSNAYICGTAGSPNAQAGGWSESNQTTGGLPPSMWASVPNHSSFPSTANIPDESASSYYRLVAYESGASTCVADSGCSGINKCGYWVSTTYNNISGSQVINESTASYIKHCGKPIAWITADSIYGLNSKGMNLSELPFNFSESYSNPVAGSNPFYIGDLQLCVNNAYSSYNTRPTPHNTYGNSLLACGGVSWNESSGGFITRVEQPVVTVGPQWISNVQPTLYWLKLLCPTCYTYPFDDMSSTFTCDGTKQYTVTFSNLNN